MPTARKRRRCPRAAETVDEPILRPSDSYTEALCDLPQATLVRIAALPVMLQRDEASKVLASRALFDVLGDSQRRLSLGLEPEEFALLPIRQLRGVFASVVIQKWSANYMRQLAATWRDFVR